ncbi:zinc-binding dehydrogenase [Horticoccus luteus]|uniref:Zinc-binding dehydrogenase n=1 Tax=Horticoccus luteus TaxID=2862869 RepID=A0A8F9TXI6_9BACT|nr:zinc-binding dehydrogenase [Horticoccus luteus]QYM80068.1 zinc-binding dehydrogenase [Horticoccus luteus]
MKAYQLTAVNQGRVADVTAPAAGAGEVVIALKAAALNHRDVWIKLGQYAGLKWPCIPGSDGAGVVESVGEGVDAKWVGREVMIYPGLGWGANEAAQSAEFSILGLPRDGTFAEKIAVPLTQIAERPAHLSWEEAAALPLAGLTAYRALFSRAKLERGERVLVNGIGGGVALFALQFAVAAGAEVWVTSSADEKIARARGFGAQGGFRYTEAGWGARAAKETGGFQVIVDGAGGDGCEQLLDAAAPGGRIVFYGATRGNPSALAMRKLFWRQISVLGSTMGSPADWAGMVAMVARHGVKPVVSDVFPLARAEEALALMERGEQLGKIVLRT